MKRNCALPLIVAGLVYTLSSTPPIKNDGYAGSQVQPTQEQYQSIDRRGRISRQRQHVPYESLSGDSVEKRVVSRDNTKKPMKSTVYLVYNGDVVSVYNDTGKGLEPQGVMLKKDLRKALSQ
ncbi:MAG: hypothetical protein HY831_02885 [Candidatus Aenigmarchaeota archaeon]|nr:hypothetical protein [Candidatus Aenigmarchaeota archaeon]